jgi:septum site-determining protein MinC
MEAPSQSHVAPAPKSSPRPVAFELKGVMTSLAVLRPHTFDLGQIEQHLLVKIAHLPQFFQDAPVVIDLGALPDGGAGLRVGGLVRLLRACHLVPVAVTNASEEVRMVAVAEGLGVMPYRAARTPTSRGANGAAPPATSHRAAAQAANAAAAAAAVVEAARAEASPPPPALAAGPGAGQPAMVVRQPVRAGQVVYAERCDLVVLGPVNPGAEVIADGHVHLYGALKGRAIAGAQGFAGAQIFCQRLEAELVAVGGAYVLSDDIPAERRGRPAMVYLADGECRIGAL